jgi:PEGA domain
MARVTDPNSNDDELFKGPTLNADGRLERFDMVEKAVPLPTGPVPRQDEPPPELAPRPPKKYEARVEQFRALPPSAFERRRRAALIAVVVLLALGVAGFAAFAVFRPRLSDLPFGVSETSLFDQLNSGEPIPVIISSTPTGAKLTIGSTVVGETPWAGENKWQGKIRVRLEAPRYKPWEGQIDGQKPVTLDIELKK